MTTEHTPTPWHVDGSYIETDQRNVARVGKHDARTPEDDANAALIVRAVNSFDAMKAALTDIRDCAHSPEQVHDQNKILGRIESVASAALALAERGEK